MFHSPSSRAIYVLRCSTPVAPLLEKYTREEIDRLDGHFDGTIALLKKPHNNKLTTKKRSSEQKDIATAAEGSDKHGAQESFQLRPFPSLLWAKRVFLCALPLAQIGHCIPPPVREAFNMGESGCIDKQCAKGHSWQIKQGFRLGWDT